MTKQDKDAPVGGIGPGGWSYRQWREAREKRCHGKHDYRYEGHGHNYSVYVCTRCGKEKEV